jgi:predicted dehydrogenase
METGMKRLKIGVVGAGLIGQLEHIPNLLKLRTHFELIGVAERSAMVRKELESRGLTAYGSYQELLDADIEVILIAAPDQYHAEITLAALKQGKHVFCEKPLCFSVAEARDIAAARDAAGKVVQVGYMKRFDPSYEKLLSLLPRDASALRSISVEVQDPDAWPFNQHQGDFVRATDLPPQLIAEGNALRQQQVRRATGRVLTGSDMSGFANSYCSGLIHDINAVHGMLDAMGIETGRVVGAAFFADGDGGHGCVRLTGCKGLWQMSHLVVPKVADYIERISVCFDDATYELTFPSAYLNYFPTRLTTARSDGSVWQKTEYRVSYEEAFVRELIGLWSSIVEGKPTRNTVEEAGRDLRLVAQLAAVALPPDE